MLVKYCQMAILGESSYGFKLKDQMCAGYPLSLRGDIPHRHICPPEIRISQSGFKTCEEGNILMCKGKGINDLHLRNISESNVMTANARDVLLRNMEGEILYSYEFDTLEDISR